MPSADRSATTSPRATSGGTTATHPQHAAHDDKYHFFPKQSPLPLSTEHSATAFRVDDNFSPNKEQFHSSVDSPRSSRSSPSAISFRSSSFSLSSVPTASHQDLAENFAHMNIESSIMPPDQAFLNARSRMRELSAPLPSVPPSTPVSVVVHRTSFSQPHDLVSSPTPSALLRGSPPLPSSCIFSSPLAEQCSDSENAEQDDGTSDSNSIEIISSCVEDSFVTGRLEVREGGNVTRGLFQSTRLSHPNASSPTLSSPVAANSLARPSTSSTSTTTSASHTPTPHPPIQSSTSPTHLDAGDIKLRTSTSSTFASSASYASLSKSPSPSRAQPRAQVSSRISSETSSPVLLHASASEPKQVSQSVPQIAPVQNVEEITRTPNVYINGLPPNFPDESLYVMTRDFGHVLSVRTFTRCVGEKMSGYGFVLFDSVDSAERCIEALRKYRNLHPSFSKQVHKIPGTPYASGTITLPPAGSLSSLSTQPSLSSIASFPSVASTLVSSSTASTLNNASSPMKGRGHRVTESISTTSGSDVSGRGYRDASFREKMEKLRDEKSTNLYMEGLPLTIDDVSLAALVSPHKIVSSRFFQTKLSDPPRMIAFVRLETRLGAEEVIERLHGRVVRGWNDNGCRISVRFADSNEQRELRRAERLARGEEDDVDGVARLSMAHAALLNLRGAETQLNIHALQQQAQSPHFGLVHTPANFLNTKHANTTGITTDCGGNFHPMTVAHDLGLGNGSTGLKAHHTSQHYQHIPALTQQTRVQGTNGTGRLPAVGSLSVHGASMDVSPTTKRADSAGLRLSTSVHSSLSTNSIDANRLVLLQQQTQLQQLQLLQQMQNAASRPEWQSIDPNYALSTHAHVQSHALMPSVDIVTTQMNDSHPQVVGGHLGTHQIIQGQQMPRAHAQQQTRPYSKGSLSELSGSATILSSNNENYLGHRRPGSEDYLNRHQHQRAANHHPVSRPVPGYTSAHFTRSDADHREELINSSNRRRTNVLEEGEITLVSPALTYASRTPSTLSPATPLFNAFSTPASAPATVPQGKSSFREREHQRSYRNELRQ